LGILQRKDTTMDSKKQQSPKQIQRDHPSLWTAMDVAKYLRVSRSWVYQKSEEGELPTLRVGGLLRFDPASIDAYIRTRAH